MNADENETLLRIAERVGDGRVVDWQAEERLHPELAGTLRWMRHLESVAREHGGLGVASGRTAGTDDPKGSAGEEGGIVKHLEIETRDRAVVIRPREDLTGGDETDAIVTHVRDALERGVSCVILDLGRVGFVNSLAIGAIIGCHVTAAKRGASFVLCNADDRIRKTLEITKLDSVLNRCDSVETALSRAAAAARGT